MFNTGSAQFYSSPFPHIVVDNFWNDIDDIRENYFDDTWTGDFVTSCSAKYDDYLSFISSSFTDNGESYPEFAISGATSFDFFSNFQIEILRSQSLNGPSKHFYSVTHVLGTGQTTSSADDGRLEFLDSEADNANVTKTIPFKDNQTIIWKNSMGSYYRTYSLNGTKRVITTHFTNTGSDAF